MKNLLNNNKFGPVTLAVLAAVSLASPVTSYAQGNERTVVRLNIEGNAKIPEWRVDSREYTDWLNSGSPFDCGNWSPATSTIDWGDHFQQLRICEQEQVRTVTPILHNRILDEYKNATPYEESQSIAISQYQPNVGTRDFITGWRPEPWSTWSDAGVHYECASWSPTPDTINLYESFVQQRDCSQNQTRSRTMFDTWASGKETQNRTETEDQTITETESRNSSGTKDYIDGERVGSWSPWAHEGSPYACEAWTPTPDTVNLEDDFTQSRDCQQDQVGDRSIYDVWRSGKETLNRVEPREQTSVVLQEQSSVGTNDYITGESFKAWSSWNNEGGIINCTAYTPAIETVNLDESFTQTRSCEQVQTREQTINNVWKSGKETLKQVNEETKVLDVEQAQAAIGTKDYVIGNSFSDWTAYENAGNPTNCSAWTPSKDNYFEDENFTQSRVCEQTERRTRTKYENWKSGRRGIVSTEVDIRTIDVDETRQQTGSKPIDWVISTRYEEQVRFEELTSCGKDNRFPRTIEYTSNGVFYRYEDRSTIENCEAKAVIERRTVEVWKSGKIIHGNYEYQRSYNTVIEWSCTQTTQLLPNYVFYPAICNDPYEVIPDLSTW